MIEVILTEEMLLYGMLICLTIIMFVAGIWLIYSRLINGVNFYYFGKKYTIHCCAVEDDIEGSKQEHEQGQSEASSDVTSFQSHLKVRFRRRVKKKRSKQVNDNSDSEDIQTNHRKKRPAYPRKQKTIKTCRSYKMNLLKKPGLIQVQGQLAKTNPINIYLQIKEELHIYYNQQNCPDVYKYLQTRVNASSRHNDIAVITLNEGYFAAYCITGNVKSSVKHLKEVISQINRYELKNPQIVLSHAYATLFRLYNIKHKLGKAHSSLEAAISCIQDQSQSCWTAYVHNKQGDLYCSLSTVRPNYKNKYKQLEEKAYLNALQHGSNESDTKNNMWDIVLNMLDLVDMKLDTPWIYLFGETGSNDTGFCKLRDYRVSFGDVKDAQQLLSAAEKHSLSLSDDCKHITYSKHEYGHNRVVWDMHE